MRTPRKKATPAIKQGPVNRHQDPNPSQAPTEARIPCNITEAIAIDKRNRNTRWTEAISKEVKCPWNVIGICVDVTNKT